MPFAWSSKKRAWLVGQKRIFKNFTANAQKSIWIHCASLGEYEAIKPLIPELKKINNHITITFFSPSGYENFQDNHLIDQVTYLPLDIKDNIKRFTHLVNPMMVVISKNDVWPNMISCLHKNDTPLFLIGFKIKKSKIDNWIIKRYYQKYLPKFSHIFCQDQLTYNFLQLNKIHSNSIIADTRITQILSDQDKKVEDQKISAFIKNDKKTIIYGSLEKGDYKIVMDFIQSREDLNHIIVPHEINAKTIKYCSQFIKDHYLTYSTLNDLNNLDENILIVDYFGILKKLYHFSDIAYIGGGFNEGVHNTLEPAIHGNYILFGPKHTNFLETNFFIENQIAFSITDNVEFEQTINTLLNKTHNTKQAVLKTVKSFFGTNKQNIDHLIEKINDHVKL